VVGSSNKMRAVAGAAPHWVARALSRRPLGSGVPHGPVKGLASLTNGRITGLRVTVACDDLEAMRRASQFFSAEGSSTDSGGDSTSQSLILARRDGERGHDLEVQLVHRPWLARLRRLAGRPQRARLLEVQPLVGEVAQHPEVPRTPFSLAPWSAMDLVFRDDPGPVPVLDTCSVPTTLGGRAWAHGMGDSLLGVREVVLGHVESQYQDAIRRISKLSPRLPSPGVALSRCPNVWRLGAAESTCGPGHAGLHLRLLPAPTASIILQVKSLEACASWLDQCGAPWIPIGRTAVRPGQILLDAPFLDGFEIRFCESANVEPLFCEGRRTLLQGVIVDSPDENPGDQVPQGSQGHIGEEAGVPPAAQQLGEESSPQTDPRSASSLGLPKTPPLRHNGDCWMEARAMLKQPSGFFRHWSE